MVRCRIFNVRHVSINSYVIHYVISCLIPKVDNVVHTIVVVTVCVVINIGVVLRCIVCQDVCAVMGSGWGINATISVLGDRRGMFTATKGQKITFLLMFGFLDGM